MRPHRRCRRRRRHHGRADAIRSAVDGFLGQTRGRRRAGRHAGCARRRHAASHAALTPTDLHTPFARGSLAHRPHQAHPFRQAIFWGTRAAQARRPGFPTAQNGVAFPTPHSGPDGRWAATPGSQPSAYPAGSNWRVRVTAGPDPASQPGHAQSLSPSIDDASLPRPRADGRSVLDQVIAAVSTLSLTLALSRVPVVIGPAREAQAGGINYAQATGTQNRGRGLLPSICRYCARHAQELVWGSCPGMWEACAPPAPPGGCGACGRRTQPPTKTSTTTARSDSAPPNHARARPHPPGSQTRQVGRSPVPLAAAPVRP